MRETLTPHIEDEPSRAEEQNDIVKDALIDVGLSVEVPKMGTPAYARLVQHARDYIAAVRTIPFEVQTQNMVPKEKRKYIYDKKRRDAHDALCIMLFGRKRDDVDEESRHAASNFAAYVAEAPEFIDTWSS